MARLLKKRRKIEAIIFEDDKSFLDKLLYALDDENISVTCVAHTIKTAAEHIARLKTYPDVVLISLEMLRAAVAVDLEYIRGLRTKMHATRLIVIGDRCAEDGRISLAREGIHGFILRSEPVDKIVKCIRVVTAGEVWMDAQIVNNIFSEYAHLHRESGRHINPPTAEHHKRLEKLTTREREILELLSMSLTNEEIARGLFISVDTVKTHVRNIFEKLSVKNRVEAVMVFIGACMEGREVFD